MAHLSNQSSGTDHSVSKSLTCSWCGGDGKETCDNPDHSFIEAMAGVGNGDIQRLGCPVCGHSEDYKVPNGGDCENCNGTGMVSDLLTTDRKANTDVVHAPKSTNP